jgi:hypothetical protein
MPTFVGMTGRPPFVCQPFRGLVLVANPTRLAKFSCRRAVAGACSAAVRTEWPVVLVAVGPMVYGVAAWRSGLRDKRRRPRDARAPAAYI